MQTIFCNSVSLLYINDLNIYIYLYTHIHIKMTAEKASRQPTVEIEGEMEVEK